MLTSIFRLERKKEISDEKTHLYWDSNPTFPFGNGSLMRQCEDDKNICVVVFYRIELEPVLLFITESINCFADTQSVCV